MHFFEMHHLNSSSLKIRHMKTSIYFTYLLAATLLVATTAQAQLITGGITAGVSTASVKISDLHRAYTNVESGQNIIGFEGGLYGRVHFGPFYIKPMALLSYQSGQVNFYNTSDGSMQSENFKSGKLEIPVMFGFKILGPLRIEAGPVYNYIFQANNDAGDVHVATSGLGYRAGASVEFWRLNVGLAYQGLTARSSGSTTYEMPSELVATLAIRLGGGTE
jgi:hypothetical protein